MATAAEQLKTILDDVARSGALTPEAIRQFDDMRGRVSLLEQKVATSELAQAAASKSVEQYRSQVATLESKLEVITKERDVLKLEQEVAKRASWIAEFEIDRRKEMRSILSDVFRNVEVHRTISRNAVIPGVSSGTNPNAYPISPQERKYTDTETTREG
jgi:chromosome segregation ATPase